MEANHLYQLSNGIFIDHFEQPVLVASQIYYVQKCTTDDDDVPVLEVKSKTGQRHWLYPEDCKG